MAKWEQAIEEGVVCYINEELGQITKLAEGAYVGLLPKVIKLGPFETLEQAQQAVVNNKAVIEQMLDDFNHNLIDLAKAVKRN